MNSGIASPNHGTIPRELHVLRGGTMKSSLIKRSVVIGGSKTSISLEDQFWNILKEIAHARGATLAQTLTEIDKTRQHQNRSSAIRLFVLGYVRDGRIGSIALAT
jgi:predicted DNA-binding ribbon-helix-helix protein